MIPDLPIDPTFRGFYGNLAWAARYMLDWGTCGQQVTTIRQYTTIIRWFHEPEERRTQWAKSAAWRRYPDQELGWQHELNLMDLLDSNVEVPMHLNRGKVGLFFASLNDGDLVTGGPVNPTLPNVLHNIRPGYAYLLSKWMLFFEDEMPPWGFWIFPGKLRFAIE